MTTAYNPYVVDGFNLEYNLTVDFGELDFNISGLTTGGYVEINSTSNHSLTQVTFNESGAKLTASVTLPYPNETINFTSRLLFNLSDLTRGYLATNNFSQELLDLKVKVCNTTIIYPVLNMAYYDEITGLAINISNAIDFAIYDGTHYYNLTTNFEGDSNNSLCTNLNPTDLSYNWNIWGNLILEADSYTSRVFEIDSGVPTLISNDPATNLNLYLIKVANSSSVTYEWLTTEFQYIDGIMRIYKCDNATRTIVESTPVVSGLANANIELVTQAYSYDEISIVIVNVTLKLTL